jgi:hypothetical protein
VSVLPRNAFTDFPTGFDGALLRPGEPAYAEARTIFNAHTDDAMPAMIARADTPAAVVTIARYAAETGTALAVRAGGHGVDGSAMPDGALVADLSRLTTIDVDRDSGRVRVGAGVLLSSLDAALSPFGLVVPSGTVSTTGIAGLTLGGGIGYNMRRYGATVDTLLSCDVVTSDGRQVRTSAEENPDLFWALRGGGGNFGIVTSLEFQAEPLPQQVMAGFLLFPIDQAHDVLAGLREHMPTAPRELAVVAVLTRCPPMPPIPPEHHGRDVLMPMIVYTGADNRADAVIGELAALGEPVTRAVAPMPWLAANQMLDAIAPPRRRYYSKGGYLAGLDEEVIDVVVGQALSAPPATSHMLPSAVQNLWAMGGAISDDHDENETAFSREGANWLWEIVTEWDRPEDDSTFHTWVDGARRSIGQHLRSNCYVNLSTDNGPAWRRGVWGSPQKYARLVQAKTTWDPHNLLRFNKNIEPA